MAGDPRLTIFEDDDFGLMHCADVDLPGYLILTIKGADRGWADAADRSLARLGGQLGRIVAALTAAAGPERVYVCAFGEETPALHFHLFPRYAWMKDMVRGVSGEGAVDGPALLSRIRRERACAAWAWSDPAAVQMIVEDLRRRLAAGRDRDATGERERGDAC